ncbi:hypothetical protein F2P81_002047 [Scophthalmus maximus]|uniref:TNFR-Cys domain-containing protein n=1 Tax=Scophthalmus maximus TaxID=52904 RepID=A0A6A4TM90_SCOMX|nr:hypothetical protein F2P81_002047 [Scophthalmus maximus]
MNVPCVHCSTVTLSFRFNGTRSDSALDPLAEDGGRADPNGKCTRQRMARRSLDSCKITCETCLTGRYLDSYNVDMTCSVCKNCKKPREALTAIAPSKPVTGTVWLLMITACLCTGIAFVVVTTVKSIRSKNGYILTEKPATASEDEGVSKPVQEVCGKCDQPIDV